MKKSIYAAFAAAPLSLSAALADDITSALDHAPIGVMGDHLHGRGEVMLSYRAMLMGMEGNRIGTDEVSPETIVSTVENVNAPPPTLRVVPVDMTMTMHMIGAMWAPTDNLTLMAMGSFISKEMDHTTFQGMAGTTTLGGFTTEASGIGDTSITALFRLWQAEHLSVHGGFGVSFPTGSIDEEDTVLTPMNTRPSLRLPYPMQIGSGTFDLKPSVTLTNKTHDARFGGGMQYSAVLRTGDNDEGYTLGDRHELTGWGAWSPDPRVSLSLRATGRTVGQIDGADPLITAPVQTANPDFQGGDTIEIGAGVNLLAIGGAFNGHRIAAEIMVPIYQDLNGPQLETDYVVTLGWQKAF